MNVFAQRQAPLKYLVSLFHGQNLWLQVVRVDTNNTEILANPTHLLALGEALSSQRTVNLTTYLESCLACFREYNSLTSGKKGGVMRLFRPRVTSRNKDLGYIPPPFDLDGRTVYIALCQAALAVHEVVSQLSGNGLSPSDQSLYTRLSDQITQHVVRVGVRSLDAEARRIIEEDKRLLLR